MPTRTGVVAALALSLSQGAELAAEDEARVPPSRHAVPLERIHQRALEAGQMRQEHLRSIDRFLAAEPVAKAARALHADRAELVKAASLLSDEDLAKLADRAAKWNRDLAAGALSNQDLTYIVIALGAAVLVLIIVAA